LGIVMPRSALTPAEREAAEEAKAQKRAKRQAVLDEQEEASPSLHCGGDPKVHHFAVKRLHDSVQDKGALLILPRAKPGTELHVSFRSWDGLMGDKPRDYVLLSTWYRTPVEGLRRTQGQSLERAELRPVAQALLDLADRLDREHPQNDTEPAPPPEAA
jgi:hypothetical protein